MKIILEIRKHDLYKIAKIIETEGCFVPDEPVEFVEPGSENILDTIKILISLKEYEYIQKYKDNLPCNDC